jgi:N-acetylglutamate synthase-like GNAT family acetyltransferase
LKKKSILPLWFYQSGLIFSNERGITMTETKINSMHDVMITDYSDIRFQNAFKQYFKDWDIIQNTQTNVVRKTGQGRTLLQKAENYFKECGIYKTILTTDTAPTFYKKCGYHQDISYNAKNKDDVFVKYL